jgi:hypothetical protein
MAALLPNVIFDVVRPPTRTNAHVAPPYRCPHGYLTWEWQVDAGPPDPLPDPRRHARMINPVALPVPAESASNIV